MLFLFALLLGIIPCLTHDGGYNALRFGTSINDYIAFNWAMTPFTDSFSICTWIKRVSTSSSTPTVFHYFTTTSSPYWEILLTSTGVDTRVVGDTGLDSSQSKFTVPTGSWFSECMTWSKSTQTSKLYLDGVLVGTDTTQGRSLYTAGGKLWFNRQHSTSSSRVFGGELYQFNMFSDVLSEHDIKKIGSRLCADLDEFSSTRVLRWEDILTKSRSGSVVDFDTGCKVVETAWRLNMTLLQLQASEDKLQATENKLQATEDTLQATEDKLQATEDKLQATEDKLESTEDTLNSVSGRLNSTKNRLRTTMGQLQISEHELENRTVELNRSRDQYDACSFTLTAARKWENISKWDILLTAPYFNKVLSEDLYLHLTSSWNITRHLIGTNITRSVVDHLRVSHNQENEFGELTPDILKHYLGVKMTQGIIDHLGQHLQEADCNNSTEN